MSDLEVGARVTVTITTQHFDSIAGVSRLVKSGAGTGTIFAVHADGLDEWSGVVYRVALDKGGFRYCKAEDVEEVTEA